MRSFWSFLIKSRLMSGSTPRRPRRRAGDMNAGGPTVRVSRQTYLKLLGVQQSVLNQFNSCAFATVQPSALPFSQPLRCGPIHEPPRALFGSQLAALRAH
jgi:hypothetical protein